MKRSAFPFHPCSFILHPCLFILCGLYLSYLGCDYLLIAARDHLLPKNFSQVEANVLYRSGQMRLEHFREMVQQHGIKTIVCLNPGENGTEMDLAQKMGLDYIVLGMPGCGKGRPEFFDRFLEIVGEPSNRPVLVHCAAGAYRTGACVALFRMAYQGWTLEDAVREMRRFGFGGRKDLVEHISRMRIAECGMRNFRMRIADCGLRNEKD